MYNLYSIPTAGISVIMFLLIVGFYFFGFQIRKRAIAKNPETAGQDMGTLGGTLLGLLALLLAFTFGMSNSRYDERRQLIVQEANAISTAYLRSQVYPDSIRQLLKEEFRTYVEARIHFNEVNTDEASVEEAFAKSNVIGLRIWNIAADFARRNYDVESTVRLLPPMNDMLDMATSRLAASEAKVPQPILHFLFLLSFCSAFLLGYDYRKLIDWIIVTGFALMLSVTIYMIIDLDRPRRGLIHLDSAYQKVTDLRQMFE